MKMLFDVKKFWDSLFMIEDTEHSRTDEEEKKIEAIINSLILEAVEKSFKGVADFHNPYDEDDDPDLYQGWEDCYCEVVKNIDKALANLKSQTEVKP